MNETIAMCDCPEIQGNWQPKVGDRVWTKEEHCEGVPCQWEIDCVMTVFHEPMRINLVMLKHGPFPIEQFVYIPSIEDMILRIKDERPNIVQLYVPVDPVEALMNLLKTYMESHNKRWNGKEWVQG